MGKVGGGWVGSIRCQNCNSISKLKKFEEEGRRKEFEDKGIMLVDGQKVPCDRYCDKGWFRSKGTLSS